MRDIGSIKAAGLCLGCGLCAGIGDSANPSIVMEDTLAGYRRPVARQAVPDDQARVIDEICPGLNIVHHDQEDEAAYHPSWGPVLESRQGWSTDDKLRLQASSGGALSAVLVHLLETGAVDYVLQTGVSDASPLRNMMAVSRHPDDVFDRAGSRYAPSSPLQDIASRLESSERFVFVGKPCDIAGLRALSRRDPRVAERIPYMLAFMCAGVPSYRGTDAVLTAMGIDDPATVVGFRYRGDGWPGYATATLPDGSTRTMTYNDSWGGVLNRHLQFRCKICPDGTGEFADITFADGWNCDAHGYPLFDEEDGRSLILTRTRKGEALLQAAIGSGHVAAKPIGIDALRQIQPFQTRRKGFVLSRLAAMLAVGRRPPRFRNLRLVRMMWALGLRENVRSYLGAQRRLVRARQQD
jgi:coenzyme F420 hydrogenase subunit beta